MEKTSAPDLDCFVWMNCRCCDWYRSSKRKNTSSERGSNKKEQLVEHEWISPPYLQVLWTPESSERLDPKKVDQPLSAIRCAKFSHLVGTWNPKPCCKKFSQVSRCGFPFSSQVFNGISVEGISIRRSNFLEKDVARIHGQLGIVLQGWRILQVYSYCSKKKHSQDLKADSFWLSDATIFSGCQKLCPQTIRLHVQQATGYSIKGLTWNLPLPWILEKALE